MNTNKNLGDMRATADFKADLLACIQRELEFREKHLLCGFMSKEALEKNQVYYLMKN